MILKLIKGIKVVFLIVVALLTLFLLVESALSFGGKLLSDPISNQDELDLILEEECKVLGLNEEVWAEFGDTINESGVAYKMGEDEYKIVLDGVGMNRSTLRHELYHIYDGHFEHNSFLHYFFVEEPQAIVYSSLGIRL